MRAAIGCLVLALGACTFAEKQLVELDAAAGDAVDAPVIDAPMIDAPMIDAPMIDARVDGPLIDARIDAPAVDAPADAAVDASLPIDGATGPCTTHAQCGTGMCCFGGLQCVPGEPMPFPPPNDCLPS